METLRQRKVSSLLQREMAMIFQQESRNLFGGAMISVTVVRVSPDLSHARVYVSIFAPSRKKEEVMTEINLNATYLRGSLGRKVGKQLRIVPELSYYLDDSIDYAAEIDRLLRE